MALNKIFVLFTYLNFINAFVITDNNENFHVISDNSQSEALKSPESELDHVFNGVYSDCFIQLSFSCLQNKTLLYLKELNRLNEVSVIGDYVQFVKLNESGHIEEKESSITQNSNELSYMIDRAVDNFFDNHVIRFRAMGKEILVPNKVEEFVGRKRRKGGGGGGGGHGGGGGGGDGGKKKMMMMVMMCMKMKLMMMLPAMMGMMGMMSFKGMMFSMMSFMISKMMLLMKILEKKGAGGGGGGGGGGDGGWAAGGGGGGAWMPAGGQDGYGGGGYDANGQWQSRSIIEKQEKNDQPIVTYVKPVQYKDIKIVKDQPKSRKKRGIIEVLQNAYLYWANKVLGVGFKKHQNHAKYKVINGIKYVYYPVRSVNKAKLPKELKPNAIKINVDDLKPIVVDDFNKGEIVEVPMESRMMKKMHKMKDNVSETVDENPWE